LAAFSFLYFPGAGAGAGAAITQVRLAIPAEAGIQRLLLARHSSGRWNPVFDVLLFDVSAELRLACGEPVTFWQLPKK
jgi:hypothetical protein